jgi:hypothetical protein
MGSVRLSLLIWQAVHKQPEPNLAVCLLSYKCGKTEKSGRHSFMMPEAVVKGELRPLRDPADDPD